MPRRQRLTSSLTTNKIVILNAAKDPLLAVVFASLITGIDSHSLSTIDSPGASTYAQAMQISLTREQEQQLAQIAAQQGKKADELASEVFNRGLAAETHFLNAVRIGQQAAHRGDYLEPSEVWAGVEQDLKT